MLSQLYNTAQILRGLVVTGLDHICMLGKKGPGISERIDGDVIPGSKERLCVFSHFDRDNRIDDYVVYYLEQLHNLGCETVLVSTSGSLEGTGVDKVRPYCRRIIVRENRGYDFGSWKVGLRDAGDLSSYDRLILANDSVYGPIRDLREVFHDMDADGYAAWGITDSLQLHYHLQSYFLVFDKSVWNSSVFTEFWRDLPYYRFKWSIISNCEVGFSQRLLRAGFRLGAFCEYRRLRDRHPEKFQAAEAEYPFGGTVNPTLRLWKILVEDCHCPFLKVALLRDNPKKLDDVNRWREALAQSSDYDVGLIERHLARMNTGP